MSRREGKRPRDRSNSPHRREDRDEDRKPYKSSRSDRTTRSRSPSPDRDRRSHKSSDSRRHSDRRSRSRSPDRNKESRRSDSARHSERSSQSEKRGIESKVPLPVLPVPGTTKAAMAEPTVESILEGDLLVKEGELSSIKTAEQAVLEEDIRRRREKVNAWREAKRLQQEEEARAKISSAESLYTGTDSVVTVASSDEGISRSSHDSTGELPPSSSVEVDMIMPESIDEDPGEAKEEEPTAHHGWSLEDDDEEDDDGDAGNNVASNSESVSELPALPAPGSPEHRAISVDEDVDSAVFKNLVATPNKSTAITHSSSALPQVTAVSLAAAVTGTAVTDQSGASANNSNKRRASRLKASKWDTDVNAEEDSPSTIKPPTNTIPVVSAPASTKTTASHVSSESNEEEEDPLEAFMNSLYGEGDVAEQKSLPSENKNKPNSGVIKVITMEDILAGNVPGEDEEQQQQQRGGRRSRREEPRDASSSTPPSPKFAPSINNYPSSSSLMAKSPSLRTIALAASTSFDNLNRGWESDAAEGAQYTIGQGGGADAMDEDDDNDNGEVPWHLMSSGEKGRRRDQPSSAGVSQYTSESETDHEYSHETEAERDARELREKAEFIEAIRKARAEEDLVRERLEKSDQSAALAAAATGGANGGKGAAAAPSSASVAAASNGAALGRLFAGEGDMIEEYEIETKRRSALEIMDEARKGKMLKEIDHSKVAYIPFRKNLYIVPRALSKLSEADVAEKREDLQIKVRGKACPVPVDTWEQCGLSDRVLQTVYGLQLKEPFAIQKQAIPAIMCGRDVIGVAKTGSGKTIAFLLPMLRHILDQPPLMDGEGPIGLIMAPARELASQIYQEAKKFTKPLGLRVTCIYGGAGVAEQIADLKRGSEIVVCTPGRMIDILCMQAGKLVSLKRVTMVVMDEADRMFDMGFEPQIKMIIQNVRPDRQTVLFSATFPKQIEKLAKTVLKIPLEIVVGERSTVNKDITQVIEVHEEEDKFLRLLQLLGVWYEKGSVLIFVDKQEKCDQLFQDLLKLGYPCLSLHGGKDQVDRDHTLHEFKTGVKTVMVATSVAGRGLDVPDIICVVNYHCPNHIEDYVHRVGRTGRAGRKGMAYTFVSQREDQYAPSMVKVLQKAGQEVPQELTDLANQFRAKVAKGEAMWVSSGFEGKGFTFDASEMNEGQKVASMQKRAYEKDQGLDAGADADDEGDDGDDGQLLSPNPAATAPTTAPATATTSAAVSSSQPLVPAAPVVPVFTADMTPLERAKALAASMAANRAASVPSSSGVVPVSAGGPIDPQAALARARLVALQMAAAGKAGAGVAASAEEHFSDELEINDYPHQARRKVTNKSSLDDLTERTGVAIISRGAFVPPGKKLEPGERRLHLIIEGTSEMSVRQAKLEIMKMLEDETIRISASGSLATTGRYSVI